MSPEEIAESEDVDQLYSQLQAAKAFQDEGRVRLLQERLRELAGHNSRYDDRRGKGVASDQTAIARIRSSSEGG